MDDLDSLREEYLALRESCEGALLATLEGEWMPAASYAPLAWLDGQAYLFLSELAAHTKNLKRCPSISLLLLEEADRGGNAFVRRRISLRAEARLLARDDARFGAALDEFKRRFGDVVDLLESLPDFQMFALRLLGGRYIRGFGQAYDLSGEGLDWLQHVHPGKQESGKQA
jgi:putative heme iron utilization protein